MNYFHSNSIAAVELTEGGELKISYSDGKVTSVPATDISLQRLKKSMERSGVKKLSKEELEQQLRELEEKRRKLEGGEEKPSKSGLGIKIGVGLLVIGLGIAAVITLVKIKND